MYVSMGSHIVTRLFRSSKAGLVVAANYMCIWMWCHVVLFTGENVIDVALFTELYKALFGWAGVRWGRGPIPVKFTKACSVVWV
jgi:hypothetical protein